MKKKICAACVSILTVCLCAANLHTFAYSPDDVAAKAREAGWPENLIQTGYNQWASGEYTQDQLDEAYNSVMDYSEQTEEFIYNQFGIDPEEARAAQKNNKPTEAETQAVPESVQNTETTADAANSQTEPAQTTTVPDSSQSDKYISDSEFIKMTMEEKQDYVNSLPAEEKTEFITTLSKEARNSIIKQLPTEEKVAIMQKYIDTASTMGMNVTVDELTDKDISVTVRNQEGIIIDKAEVGIVIDETGISHTKPLLTAGIGILLSAAGFGWLYWYIKHTEQES